MKIIQYIFILINLSSTFGLSLASETISRQATTESENQVQQTPLNNNPNPYSPISIADVQRFSAALSGIKSYYVEEVKNSKLFDNAIRGMLEGLDPHSSYLDEDEFSELSAFTKGEFGGLGIEVTQDNGIVKVISPLDNSPASKVGIKSGDYIIKIDNILTQGMDLSEAVKMMKGKVGESVKLTIIRKGEKKPLTFVLAREEVKIPSVKDMLFDKKYAYVRISQFQETTASEFLKAINKLKKSSQNKLAGLILDLRNNPGGLLDSAIVIADHLINTTPKNKELIVFTKGRIPEADFEATGQDPDILQGKPVVVLINEGSASGAEIVAGALRDNKRAVLVGAKSFGKGSVQTVIPLDSKHGIKLTTAYYFTPSGQSIQAKGISPDITIDNIPVVSTQSEAKNELNISEADLAGHLENPTSKKNIQNITTENKLLKEDYQLSEALKILKAMAITNKNA